MVVHIRMYETPGRDWKCFIGPLVSLGPLFLWNDSEQLNSSRSNWFYTDQTNDEIRIF